MKVNGNRTINNLIKTKLNTYNSNDEKKIYIDINTKYIKDIIAKDTTGAATEYKLTINASFSKFKWLRKRVFFQESFNMKSISDKLEEQDYEKNIQSNLVNILLEN